MKTLEEWKTLARLGTSGDMVENILQDWEADQVQLATDKAIANNLAWQATQELQDLKRGIGFGL